MNFVVQKCTIRLGLFHFHLGKSTSTQRVFFCGGSLSPSPNYTIYNSKLPSVIKKNSCTVVVAMANLRCSHIKAWEKHDIHISTALAPATHCEDSIEAKMHCCTQLLQRLPSGLFAPEVDAKMKIQLFLRNLQNLVFAQWEFQIASKN